MAKTSPNPGAIPLAVMFSDLFPEAAIVRVPVGNGGMNGIWWPGTGGVERKTQRAAIYLHGRALDMFSGLGPAAARRFSRGGIPTLLFDRRGSHLARVAEGSSVGGAAHHGFADHEEDLAAAIGWVLSRGFHELILLGHSQGGLLAARYAAGRPEKIRALLLASPIPQHVPIPALDPAADWGRRAKAEARRLVEEGRGEELMLLEKWVFVIKPRLALEQHPAAEDGALRQALGQIHCPLYLSVGTEGVDRRFQKAAAAAAEASPAALKRMRVREGGDHLYASDAEAISGDMWSFLEEAGVAPRRR